jgi:hypothetical protein
MHVCLLESGLAGKGIVENTRFEVESHPKMRPLPLIPKQDQGLCTKII